MNLPAAQKRFSDDNAQRLSRSTHPEHKDREVVRFWPDCTHREMENGVQFLDTYTAEGNPKNRMYVDDLELMGEKLEDRWRNARVWAEKDRGQETWTVYQMLRFGYATTTTADEARHVQASGLAQDDDQSFTRAWHNIAPASALSIVQALYAVKSYTDLACDGNTLSGVWYNAGVTYEVVDDGSVVIRQRLREGYITGVFANEAAIGAVARLQAKEFDVAEPHRTASETVKRLVRRVEHIDPAVVKAIEDQLDDAYDGTGQITDPVASGETFTGTWTAVGTVIRCISHCSPRENSTSASDSL